MVPIFTLFGTTNHYQHQHQHQQQQQQQQISNNNNNNNKSATNQQQQESRERTNEPTNQPNQPNPGTKETFDTSYIYCNDDWVQDGLDFDFPCGNW